MPEIVVDTDDLVTLSQIARRFGYTRPAIANWITRYSNFPAPVISTEAVKLYSMKAVMAWAQQTGE